jgi:glyoxylase-like metal-dependent hydrolase (beta-lactamase superfamily II)
MIRPARIAALGAVSAALALPVLAQTVKVTPLGGFDGEFCAQDRALVFEDPNGTRVLYDAGRSVMGASDPRLGKVDIILITHTHGDHLGNAHTKAIGAGTCAAPDFSSPTSPIRTR